MNARSIRIEAPGKLVLLGEYAVVDGAPALSVAVAHGVAVDVFPAKRRFIRTPGGDDRFVRAALDAINAPEADYRFEDAHSLSTQDKPGMGGSAAAVVAALLAGGCSRDALVETGIRVHRDVQGSGSGIDVATSAMGGGIRFQAERAVRVELPMPIVVYAGESAKTGPRVTAYRSWAGRGSFCSTSTELVDAFVDDPRSTTREAYRLLCSMARQAGIAYQTPAIDAVVALAESMGGAAKPSGAGGGDAVIAWVEDVAAFQKGVQGLGLPVLPVLGMGPPTYREQAGE